MITLIVTCGVITNHQLQDSPRGYNQSCDYDCEHTYITTLICRLMMRTTIHCRLFYSRTVRDPLWLVTIYIMLCNYLQQRGLSQKRHADSRRQPRRKERGNCERIERRKCRRIVMITIIIETHIISVVFRPRIIAATSAACIQTGRGAGYCDDSAVWRYESSW